MRLIDADALKEELENWAVTLPSRKAFGRSETLYLIDMAPTIYAVKHGNWETLPLENYPFVCRCSVCKEKQDGHTLFCPTCGAYMDDVHRAIAMTEGINKTSGGK